MICNIPNSLQMHGTDLDNVTDLLALENAIPTTTCHACHVQQLGAVDHGIVYDIGQVSESEHGVHEN